MSKRLCVFGLLLVLFAGTPALAQLPQNDEVSTKTFDWTLLPDWLQQVLHWMASAGVTTPTGLQEPPQDPSGERLSPTAAITGEDDTTTESGQSIEPTG